jgi:hypothetical protein
MDDLSLTNRLRNATLVQLQMDLPRSFARNSIRAQFLTIVVNLTSATRSEDGEFLLLAALKVAASAGESGKKEFFRQIGADALRCSNHEIAEHEPNTSI